MKGRRPPSREHYKLLTGGHLSLDIELTTHTKLTNNTKMNRLLDTTHHLNTPPVERGLDEDLLTKDEKEALGISQQAEGSPLMEARKAIKQMSPEELLSFLASI